MKEKLKELRKQHGLTQEELSNYLGIKLSTYKQYETDRTEPNIDTLIKLANYYDISLDFLCERPRPYDLPSATTQEQKEAVAIILKLNAVNTLRAISYCAGLLTNQS